VSNLNNWMAVAKPVRGSTAKHKGKAQPIFGYTEGKCEVRGVGARVGSHEKPRLFRL